MPIQNLRIFGKSEQVQTTGKNLWSLGDVSFNAYKELSVNYPAGNYVLSFDVDTFASSTTVQVGINIDGIWKYQQISKSSRGIFKIASAAGVTAVRFYAGANPSYNVNARYYNIQIEKGTEVTGYEPYTGGKPSPSPDYPQEITIAGESGTIDLEITGENVEPQTLTVSTPNGLPGLKVDKGGNYTDSTGQQWICDEIDLGKGKYVQRIARCIYDGSEKWDIYTNQNKPNSYGCMNKVRMVAFTALFNRYVSMKHFALENGQGANGEFQTIIRNDNCTTIESLKEELSKNNLEAIMQLKNPIEYDLLPEEIQAYKALHTNYPTTVISNDEDAGMEVSYIADTKKYIDKKFEELNQAIVNTQIALL